MRHCRSPHSEILNLSGAETALKLSPASCCCLSSEPSVRFSFLLSGLGCFLVAKCVLNLLIKSPREGRGAEGAWPTETAAELQSPTGQTQTQETGSGASPILGATIYS